MTHLSASQVASYVGVSVQRVHQRITLAHLGLHGGGTRPLPHRKLSKPKVTGKDRMNRPVRSTVVIPWEAAEAWRNERIAKGQSVGVALDSTPAI